jgi:NAD-reducing hydrogenase large subunit
MAQKLVIDPVTRVEGHGKVTIHLDDENKVKDAFFHIVEFRGFERFIQGHPYWEAPVLVQRLCGICPVSHHLAAAKAIDQIVGIDPENLPPTATKLRRMLHYAQVLQSHALHFFYLASPDLLFGLDAPLEKRNVMQVAIENKDLAHKGIVMRKFGQELIKALAGKKIHGITAVPGGVHKTFTQMEREYFLNGKEVPSIDTIIDWSQEVLEFIKNYHLQNHKWLDSFASYPSGHLGLVTPDGDLDLYNGMLRAIDYEGNETLMVKDIEYANYFSEDVKPWSFLKFPYLKELGRENGWNRVGPLARMNVCKRIDTPLANIERKQLKGYTEGKPNNMTMHTHWARLIEILHCAEKIRLLLHDDSIMGDDLRAEGVQRNEGIGIIEAPRGTLIHHYLVNDNGRIERCNLIVSTTHNNEAMNRAVKWVAEKELSGKKEITEPMLNQVEVAIRAYDPCLSCATHSLGQMPLKIELFNHEGNIVDTRYKG